MSPFRSAAALFVGVAASAMGYTMVVAVVPLAAEDLLGSAQWSGAPSALATTGIAVGTTWLAAIMVRRGRRFGLAVGYWMAMVAAGVAAVGAALGAFSVMAVALFFLGAGYASSRLSRYAAAELFPPARRSAAIGWNVWGATVGAVAGPLLLDTTRVFSLTMDIPETTGPFVVAAVVLGISGLAVHLGFTPARRQATGPTTGLIVRPSSSGVRLAVAALVVGQVVMVLVMTMTPIHIRHHGESLNWVGIVFASHTFGMFALSPLAGILSDRIGRVPVIVAASVALAGAGLLAAAAPPDGWPLALALFLLGLGWCFSFVAGSALLTESLAEDRRVRVQGWTDSLIWGSAAMAGLGSGVLLFSLGYPALGRVGAVLAMTPLLLVPAVRRAASRPAAASP